MAKRKVSDREHKMGKHTGYDTNGVDFWVAPTWKNQWSAMDAEEVGVTRLVENTNAFAQRFYTEIRKRRLAWWDEIYDELGLDREIKYLFDRLTSKLTPSPVESSAGDVA